MKFRLIESLDTKYYHITPYKLNGNKLYPNEQGLHLTYTIEAAESVMIDRHITDYDIYSVTLPFEPKPVLMDFDLSYWSASEIASCLLLKLGENIQPETTFDNQKITPDMIHIDNLNNDDKDFLYDIYNSNNTYSDFFRIMDFLKEKGFNSIKYPLKESTKLDYSLVVNIPLTATPVNDPKAVKTWKYSDEMQTEYNNYYKGK